MISIEEIRENMKRLRGEIPSGREWEKTLINGSPIWVDTKAQEQIKSSRPDNWRKNQTRTIMGTIVKI